MQPVGWRYPPPAAPPTTAAGATGGGATPQPPPHAVFSSCTTGTAAAVHDAVGHAATSTCRAHYCFRCACYALVVRANSLVVRTTHVLVARALSSFPQMLSQQLTQFSPTQPLWPAPGALATGAKVKTTAVKDEEQPQQQQVHQQRLHPACALQGIAARWLSAHYKTIARSIARAMAPGLGFVTPCPNKQGKNAYFSKVSDASGTACDAVNVS